MRAYLLKFEEQCDAILSDVNSALEHLALLQKQYLFVSTKTGTLHEACEQLLKEQVTSDKAGEVSPSWVAEAFPVKLPQGHRCLFLQARASPVSRKGQQAGKGLICPPDQSKFNAILD